MVPKYLNKISGLPLDRIDIHLGVVPVHFKKLSELNETKNRQSIRNRVIKVREIQLVRLKKWMESFTMPKCLPSRFGILFSWTKKAATDSEKLWKTQEMFKVIIFLGLFSTGVWIGIVGEDNYSLQLTVSVNRIRLELRFSF